MAMATAPEIQRYQSLIPYLQGKRHEPLIKLDLFPWGARQNSLAYPFALVDDSDPLCRRVEARFVTDTGHTLKKVLLQIQKDHYSFPLRDPGTRNNGEIDATWRALVLEEEGGAVLQVQRGPQGEPVPLAPLFYCRETRRFFPPLCPSCALLLTLCTDDTLLEAFGLAPYHTSLKRYLHCGSCAQRGLQEFYQYENEPVDPVTVKDRWTLVERFRQVESSMDPDGQLPCVSCAAREACFGEEHEARRRIVPFSFYPFHLLIMETPTLNAAVSPPSAADDCRILPAEKLKEQARKEAEELGGLAPQVPVPLAQRPRAAASPVAPVSKEAPAAPAAPAAQSAFDDDETMETVILSPGAIRPREMPMLSRGDLCETCLPGSSPVSRPAAPLPHSDEIMETMAAPASRLHPAAPGSSPADGGETSKPAPAARDGLVETIFVSPSGRRPE